MDPKFILFLALALLGVAGFRYGVNITLVVFVLAVAAGFWFFFKGLGDK